MQPAKPYKCKDIMDTIPNFKISLTLSIILSFSVFFSIFQVSYGQMAVVDAPLLETAKLNYIETINSVAELRENVEQTKKLILDTSKMKDTIGSMRTEMSTIFNNTFGLIGELNRLRDEILETPDDINAFMQEFKDNADCLFDDLDKYQQVETIYKSRYVFKDNFGGTPENPADDPYVFKDGSDMAGAFDPLQLKENPCGHTVTYFSKLKAKYDEERSIIDRLTGVWVKTEEELTESKRFYVEMDKKVEETKTEKETLDTMKTILWAIHGKLVDIDKTLGELTLFIVNRSHDPNKLYTAPGLSSEMKNKLKMNNVKAGVATGWQKKAAIWKSLGKATPSPLIR
jgi:hypothetical protein